MGFFDSLDVVRERGVKDWVVRKIIFSIIYLLEDYYIYILK